ncbi:MAG: DUF5009 domain-containing protein [Planctomycetota bacterium]|nr:MAG: DUF5009 domain-containing protein [Planctomycetota bacterium]
MSTATTLPTNRLTSVDAYRGMVMLLMLGEVLRLHAVTEALPGSPVWGFLAWHQTHVEWIGCTLHDLIQPSFSLLVGLVLPFSLASRMERGESPRRMILHALGRSLILIFLGIFLRSLGKPQTNFTFDDTLTQIGMGYFFLFLLGRMNWKIQGGAFLLIVVGYWGLFAASKLPAQDFDWAAVGVNPEWRAAHELSGFSAHWNKNSQPAWAFDVWWMNLFPREKPFTHSPGGYCTLSFIPTLGTMLLGLLAGGWLRSSRTPLRKLVGLLLASGLCFGIAWTAARFDLCPIVKRIWTPSWVFFSGGWCLAILSVYYAVIEIGGWKRWAFPLLVVGSNSIAAYCSEWILVSPIRAGLHRHLGTGLFESAGAYQPLAEGVATLLVIWLILFWLYRQRIFLRI